jgi:hypothetical protein
MARKGVQSQQATDTLRGVIDYDCLKVTPGASVFLAFDGMRLPLAWPPSDQVADSAGRSSSPACGHDGAPEGKGTSEATQSHLSTI